MAWRQRRQGGPTTRTSGWPRTLSADIYSLEGDGLEAGLLAGPASGGYSGSVNSEHADLMCQSPSGDSAMLDGLFISGGGEGLGLGAYVAGTRTWVQKWINTTW